MDSKRSKQPWEMGLLEYGKSRLPSKTAAQITEARQVASFSGQHIKEIKAAIGRADFVPKDVLMEYRGAEWADGALRDVRRIDK